jgi:hypothetical protein
VGFSACPTLKVERWRVLSRLGPTWILTRITAADGPSGTNTIDRNRQEQMALPPYDILKKDAAALVWVEAVEDLEFAKQRVRELSVRSEAEYVIFDQRTRQIIERVNTPSISL